MITTKPRILPCRHNQQSGSAFLFVLVTIVMVLTLMGITLQVTKGMRDGIRNFYTVTQSLALASHSLPWQNQVVNGARWGAILNGVPEDFVRNANPNNPGCRPTEVCNSGSWGKIAFDYRQSGSPGNNTAVDQIHVFIQQELGFLSGAFALFGNFSLGGLSTAVAMGASSEHMFHYVAIDRSMSFAGPAPQDTIPQFDYRESLNTLFSTAGLSGTEQAVQDPFTTGAPPDQPCFPLNIAGISSVTDSFQLNRICNSARRAFPFYLSGRRARPARGIYEKAPRNLDVHNYGTALNPGQFPSPYNPNWWSSQGPGSSLPARTPPRFYNPNLWQWYSHHTNPDHWGRVAGSAEADKPVLVCGSSNEPTAPGRFNQPGVRILPTYIDPRIWSQHPAQPYPSYSYAHGIATVNPVGSLPITESDLCVLPWDSGPWHMTRWELGAITQSTPLNRLGEYDLCNSQVPLPAEFSSGCTNQLGSLWLSASDMKLATDRNVQQYLITTSEMTSENIVSLFSAATWHGPVSQTDVNGLPLTGNNIIFNGNVGQPNHGRNLYDTPINLEAISKWDLPNGVVVWKNLNPIYGPLRLHRMLEHVGQDELPILSMESDPLSLGLPAAARRVSRLLEPLPHPTRRSILPFSGAMISAGLVNLNGTPRYGSHPATPRNTVNAGDDGNYEIASRLDYRASHPQPSRFFPANMVMRNLNISQPMNAFYQNRYDHLWSYREIIEDENSSSFGRTRAGTRFNNDNQANVSAYAPALIPGTALAAGGTDTIGVINSMVHEAEIHARTYPDSPRVSVLITDGRPNLEFCNVPALTAMNLTCAQISFADHLQQLDGAITRLRAIRSSNLIVIFVRHPSETPADALLAAQFRDLVTRLGGLVMTVDYNTTAEFNDRFGRALRLVATLLRGPLRWVS